MVTQETTVTGLLNLIAELRAREKEQAIASEKTKSDIDAVQRALELLSDKYDLPAPEVEKKIPALLQTMTYHEGLIALAQANYGRIKVTEAKRTFLQEGIIPNPKTAYQQITSRLVRSDRFRRVAPGEYELI